MSSKRGSQGKTSFDTSNVVHTTTFFFKIKISMIKFNENNKRLRYKRSGHNIFESPQSKAIKYLKDEFNIHINVLKYYGDLDEERQKMIVALYFNIYKLYDIKKESFEGIYFEFFENDNPHKLHRHFILTDTKTRRIVLRFIEGLQSGAERELSKYLGNPAYFFNIEFPQDISVKDVLVTASNIKDAFVGNERDLYANIKGVLSRGNYESRLLKDDSWVRNNLLQAADLMFGYDSIQKTGDGRYFVGLVDY